MEPTVHILESELNRARAGLADLEREFADLADPDTVALDDEHDSEGSTIGFERARVAGLIERVARRIADMEAALVRVGDGTFGSCTSCGCPIDPERMEALPATTTCVACAR